MLAYRIAGKGSLQHLVTADEFTRLVSKQLRNSLYRSYLRLGGRGKRGAIGVLFKLKLKLYDYIFISKRILSGSFKQLQHEYRVYARLATLEDWGGERAADAGIKAAELEAQRRRSSGAISSSSGCEAAFDYSDPCALGGCLVLQGCGSGQCQLEQLGGRWTCCRCRRSGSTFRSCAHPMRRVSDTLCHHTVCLGCWAGPSWISGLGALARSRRWQCVGLFTSCPPY
ncbi:hypothetical protein PG991_009208 [Apiospora marii]|uniref:Uncharacterized protein n=1 Tax=Apiospora marii TaxID=335849 RepID=A0ABR1RJZ6_9PEZI